MTSGVAKVALTSHKCHAIKEIYQDIILLIGFAAEGVVALISMISNSVPAVAVNASGCDHYPLWTSGDHAA
jgi:hypothetical protein